jgi:hypothetical protein
MNTLIDLEIAKLLKEMKFKDVIHYNNMGEYFTNTTIAEVVMWLYENHKIWIVSLPLLINGVTIEFYP